MFLLFSVLSFLSSFLLFLSLSSFLPFFLPFFCFSLFLSSSFSFFSGRTLSLGLFSLFRGSVAGVFLILQHATCSENIVFHFIGTRHRHLPLPPLASASTSLTATSSKARSPTPSDAPSTSRSTMRVSTSLISSSPVSTASSTSTPTSSASACSLFILSSSFFRSSLSLLLSSLSWPLWQRWCSGLLSLSYSLLFPSHLFLLNRIPTVASSLQPEKMHVLEINLISDQGLQVPTGTLWRMQTYAVAWVDKGQRIRTRVDKVGGEPGYADKLLGVGGRRVGESGALSEVIGAICM